MGQQVDLVQKKDRLKNGDGQHGILEEASMARFELVVVGFGLVKIPKRPQNRRFWDK